MGTVAMFQGAVSIQDRERNKIVAKPIWLYLVGSVSGRYYLIRTN